MTEIVVVGGGVIGLTSAIRLREAGFSVEVWAKAYSPQTTSDIAAAIWYPYKALPEDKVREWGARTLAVFREEISKRAAGVSLPRGIKYFHRPMGFPWWRELAPYFRVIDKENLPAGIKTGYEYELPVIDMAVYLPRLGAEAKALGIALQTRTVASLDEAHEAADLVVNCTGLGARELCQDRKLFPIRGDLVLLEKMKEPRVFMDSDHPQGDIYVIPRQTETVVGGTAIDFAETTELDAGVLDAIEERARESFSPLAGLKRLGGRVGLRPGRSAIRLAREGNLIHNYGHGGSGVTLSWGCAEACVALAKNR